MLSNSRDVLKYVIKYVIFYHTKVKHPIALNYKTVIIYWGLILKLDYTSTNIDNDIKKYVLILTYMWYDTATLCYFHIVRGILSMEILGLVANPRDGASKLGYFYRSAI